MPGSFGRVIETNKIVVCVGSGGVGKTTTAASFAIEAARRGKRALVLTIDPAKRLANSLGLKNLGHDVQVVDRKRLESIGPCQAGGTLSAMMLDQKRAFDEMVESYAKDPESIKRIFANPMYQQVAGTLTGSQEYAALTKLQHFDQCGEYDFIVVDTPPTTNALDFLDAPRKLSEAIDSPAIGMFRKVSEGGSFSILGKTSAYVFKMLAKFVGSGFLDDITLFFGEFNDILGGFKARAEEVFTLLHRDDVAFVVVTSPDTMAVQEALFFHERLVQTKMPFAGFVINKVHADLPVSLKESELVDSLGNIDTVEELGLQSGSVRIAAEALLDAHRNLQVLAKSDKEAIVQLLKAAPNAECAEIPFFRQDVHQIESLGLLRNYLFS